MATGKSFMSLVLGIGVLSDDLSVQREIVEAARQNNIKYLDTARNYVFISLNSA
jgi:aflatoxin B1 aldehyde reductase